ncbi:MAG: hypothetical protein EBR82_37955 [Caulobacteraceae bacterium]|nr:hypothetical protein [Caulobacteraceae bacterium]
MGAPVPGQIYVGRNGRQYRYNGGDPRAQSSYSLVQQSRSTTYSEQDSAAKAAAAAEAKKARDTLALAEQFYTLNRNTGTGDWMSAEATNPESLFRKLGIGMPGRDRYSNLQTMNALTNSMVQANIQPGTSSTMNSDAERRGLALTYPSVLNPGSTNVQILQNMRLKAQLEAARTAAMDRYLAQKGDLSEFDAAWAPQEQSIRGAFGRSIRRPASGAGAAGSSRNVSVNY